MKHAAFRIAPSIVIDRDDQAAMSEALVRLYEAAAHTVSDAVADLRRANGPGSRSTATAGPISTRSGSRSRPNAILDSSSLRRVPQQSASALFAQSRDASALVGQALVRAPRGDHACHVGVEIAGAAAAGRCVRVSRTRSL